MVAVEEDHPGARPRRPGEPPQRLLEAVDPDQAHDRGRFPAGDDEPVEVLELLRLAHLDRLGAEAPQHGRVLAEVALDGRIPILGTSYQPRVSSSSSGRSDAAERPDIASPRPRDLREDLRVVVVRRRLDDRLRDRRSGSADLKIPEPTKTPSAPSCMQSAASAGVAMPPAVKVTTGSRPCSATHFTSSTGAWSSFASAKSSSGSSDPSFGSSRRRSACRTALTMSPVPFALGADHAPFRDPAERLAEVLAAADERHREAPLVDVVRLVRGRVIAFVDVVDLERSRPGLDEVADPRLGHHRDRHGLLESRRSCPGRPCARRRPGPGCRQDALERHHSTAPASSAIRACSAVVTSMITPPLSISARPLRRASCRGQPLPRS